MPYKPGHKKIGGRTKGTPNKRTLEFRSVLEANCFCPATALIEIYNDAREIYKGYSVIYTAIQSAKSVAAGFDVPLEDKAHIYLKIAADAAKDLAAYTYPRLKSIEHNQGNSLDGLTPEQKLELAKQAVKYLEAQAKE